MRRAALIALITVVVVLQLSLLPGLRPLGVVPNLAVVVMVLAALNVVTSEALVAAAASGLVLDLASGANFGLWTGVFMLITLVVGVLRRAGIELDGAVVAPGLVAAATLVITLVVWLALAPKGVHWTFGGAAGQLVVELVINLVLTIALAPLVRWMLGGTRAQTGFGG
jgi:rod shape-determining protein MreD